MGKPGSLSSSNETASGNCLIANDRDEITSMPALGHERTLKRGSGMSASPPIADIRQCKWDVECARTGHSAFTEGAQSLWSWLLRPIFFSVGPPDLFVD
jgi:hypothetical protein